MRLEAGSAKNYVRHISGMEAVDQISAAQLKALVFSLARRHSLLTWFRIWHFFRNRARTSEANRPLIKRELVTPSLAGFDAQEEPDESDTSSV